MGRIKSQDHAETVNIRSILLGVFLLVELHLFAATAAAESDTSEYVKQIQEIATGDNSLVQDAPVPLPITSIYLVMSSRLDNKGNIISTTRGVAFAVQRDGGSCTLVTAYHVIHDATNVNVYRLHNDMSIATGYEAKVTWGGERKDVAGLTIRTKMDCTPITASVAPLLLGQRTYSFLNAPMQRGMVTAGTLGAVWDTEAGPVLVIDMRAHPGNSGSPLIDLKGQLIGMIISRSQLPEISMAYALPVPTILSEISANRKLDVVRPKKPKEVGTE